MQILHEPVTHQMAWTGRQMRERADWAVDWPEEAIAEVEGAVRPVDPDFRRGYITGSVAGLPVLR